MAKVRASWSFFFSSLFPSRSSPQLVLMFELGNLLWRVGMVTQKRLNDWVDWECVKTCARSIVWNLNSNETWFSARIFPRLESTECRDFRHKCAHTSWLPRRRSWPAGDLQKWEISGKMRDESLRAFLIFIVRPSAAEPKSLKTLLYWSTYIQGSLKVIWFIWGKFQNRALS